MCLLNLLWTGVHFYITCFTAYNMWYFFIPFNELWIRSIPRKVFCIVECCVASYFLISHLNYHMLVRETTLDLSCAFFWNFTKMKIFSFILLTWGFLWFILKWIRLWKAWFNIDDYIFKNNCGLKLWSHC